MKEKKNKMNPYESKQQLPFTISNRTLGGFPEEFNGSEEHSGVLIRGINFNPYVFDKDRKKVYYQRGDVWDMERKQNFIEACLLGIACGVVLFRENNIQSIYKKASEGEEGEDGLYFYDCVDGKQRLKTLFSFYNNEFPTKDGIYWKDFSIVAQRKFRFTGGVLQAGIMNSNVTDKEVLDYFLTMYYNSVQMDADHMARLKNVY